MRSRSLVESTLVAVVVGALAGTAAAELA